MADTNEEELRARQNLRSMQEVLRGLRQQVHALQEEIDALNERYDLVLHGDMPFDMLKAAQLIADAQLMGVQLRSSIGIELAQIAALTARSGIVTNDPRLGSE